MLDHQHLLITSEVRNPPISERDLNAWLDELVELIGMEKLMGPYSKYLNDEGNRGITGVVVIKTSHIAIHVWDECVPAKVQMDVYSCKDFNDQDVFDHLGKFGASKIIYRRVDRNVPTD